MTAVNKQVVQTVLFAPHHWSLNQQLIRICRPLVDAIAVSESDDATLADCMLELIYAHHTIDSMEALDSDNREFLEHAQLVVREQFHSMNTDVHWLCLFLHPMCRKLAVSSAPHSRNVRDACLIAAKLAIRWGYTEEQSRKLIADIHAYSQGKAPFTGGKKDAKEWYTSLLASTEDHPLKSFALVLFAIKPTAADIERLFSHLGIQQGPRRSKLTVENMEALGILHSHYVRDINEQRKLQGKPIRRQHKHMHTQNEPGIDNSRVDVLSGVYVSDEAESEEAALDNLDRQYRRLKFSDLPVEDGDGLASTVATKDVYDVSQIENIRKAIIPTPASQESNANQNRGQIVSYDAESLLESMGI